MSGSGQQSRIKQTLGAVEPEEVWELVQATDHTDDLVLPVISGICYNSGIELTQTNDLW